MADFIDKEVIGRIKNGEIDYFSHIVKKYTKPIYHFIAKRVNQKEDVEDLTQKAFLKLYRSIDRFDEEKPVLPYLFAIAQNEMKMFWRGLKKTVALDERMAGEDEDTHWQDEEDVRALLKNLPAEQEHILQLLYEGYSYQDIAGKLKKPLNTIKTMVRRARLQLLKEKHEKS